MSKDTINRRQFIQIIGATSAVVSLTMFNQSNAILSPHYLHKEFIENLLIKPLQAKGSLYVGNNLNQFVDFSTVEKYADLHKKIGTDRQQKYSKDVIADRLAEEVLRYLLEKYFSHNQLDYEVIGGKNIKSIVNTFKIVHEKLGNEKTFDIDIAIRNKSIEDKYFLISCKGSSRERIGQFISNLFLMDDRLIKTKYNDRYYLDFHTKGIQIMYGFVCYDWAKGKDFIKYNNSGKPKKTVKQTEVFLINDDNYIGGGVTILNNLKNLDGVINFGELVGKISHFLN